jgi:hypothetical protein
MLTPTLKLPLYVLASGYEMNMLSTSPECAPERDKK